jgi:hypothetical protein
MKQRPTGEPRQLVTEGACDECLQLGWFVSSVDREPGEGIERCDNCAVLPDDAVAATVALAEINMLAKGGSATEKQRSMVAHACRVLAEAIEADDYDLLHSIGEVYRACS